MWLRCQDGSLLNLHRVVALYVQPTFQRGFRVIGYLGDGESWVIFAGDLAQCNSVHKQIERAIWGSVVSVPLGVGTNADTPIHKLATRQALQPGELNCERPASGPRLPDPPESQQR